METIETINYKNCLIKIYSDENCESPEDWGNNDVFLVGYHRDFYVKNDDIITEEEAMAIHNGKEYERSKEIEKNYYIFNLEAYIHSGVSLSLSYEGNFPDRRWDVSQLGMVLVSKKESKDKKNARKMALNLIDTWNNYLSGNVYGFNAENEKLGIDIDSCWGFYGRFEDSGIIERAKESIDYWIKNESKNRKKEVDNYSTLTLGELIGSKNEGIRRNAIGILKQLNKKEPL